jgi:NAD(P)-dependent dehydrogenase (short-subunit alcohol dehydrogenase family)
MTQRWARDLRPYNIAAIALDPGFVASEMVVANSTNAVSADAREKFTTSSMQPMTVPAQAMASLCTSASLLDFSGNIVIAKDYLGSLQGLA